MIKKSIFQIPLLLCSFSFFHNSRQKMIDKISTEALLRVFASLLTRDKLQCNIVCKSWHDKICNSNLYESLAFAKQYSFSKSKFFLFTKPKFIPQVRVLNKIAFGKEKASNLRSALTAFTNIREVKWIGSEPEEYRDRSDYFDQESFTKIWENIEKLTIDSEYFCLRNHLLATGTYSNLKYLNVTLNTIEDWENQTSEELKGLPDIINYITNAPALETIIFTRVSLVKQQEFEQLHAALPNLK